jgi:hypothetical protein
VAVLAATDARALSWTAEWRAGTTGTHLDLERTVQDGIVEEVEVDGQPAVQTWGFLYFVVKDEFLVRAGADAFLEIEYLDVEPKEVFLQYDAWPPEGRASYRNTEAVATDGTGQWQTLRLEMPDAWLENGENHGADMRLVMTSTKPFGEARPLPIRRARIGLTGLAGQDFGTREEMLQALWNHRVETAIGELALLLEQADRSRARSARLARTLTPGGQTYVNDLTKTAVASAEALRAASSQESVPATEADCLGILERLQRSATLLEQTLMLLDSALAVDERLRLGPVAEAADWTWYARPPLAADCVVLPYTCPEAAELGKPLSLQACPGEFEPVSFTLLSRARLEQVRLSPTALVHSDGSSIPSQALDLRLVVCWYQSGRVNETVSGRELVPELLVHDATAFRTDLVRQQNILGFDDLPTDTETLQPFTVEPLLGQQVWITVRVPDDAAPGVYRGRVLAQAPEQPDLEIPVRLEVLPFRLRKSPVFASMYYSQLRHTAGVPEDVYRRRLEDMRDHGLTDPEFALPMKDGGIDLETARAELELRRELGLNQGPLLTVGGYSVSSYLGDGSPEPEKRRKLTETIETVNALAAEFGYDGAYVYGIDEASGDALRAEVPVFRVVGELGGKVWSACLTDVREIAARDLHLPNYSGLPDRELVRTVHEAGNRISRYGSPQGGAEDPWQWRYRYGLVLWLYGLDGGCTWCYRTAIGSPWDDFDDPKGTYRDFMMTYPSTTGPIPTVQWEGYREAQDDLRYMAALEHEIERVREQAPDTPVLAEATAWITDLRNRTSIATGDLESLRELIVARILELRATVRAE